ncbi:MAG TPA: O-antigen ligase family protein [Trichocoleus sp.]|jgi:O-antigen ligase
MIDRPTPHAKVALFQRIFRVSFASLSYLYVISMAGIAAVMVYLMVHFKRSALDPLTRNALLFLSGALVLSCLFAFDRGEAFLQLVHFLPFFLLFSLLPYLMQGAERMERLAIDLVIATIPLNFLAAIEAMLKSNLIPRTLQRVPIVRWVRSTPHAGRAMLMFNHPNSLSVYLLMVLGLGLGVLFCQTIRHPGQPMRRPSLRTVLLYIGTYLTLLGIFSTGSRNGLLLAIVLVLLFSLLNRSNRIVLGSGLVSLAGLVFGAIWLGVGGRSISLSWVNDARWRVWQIALDLIRERPWLGWGLGNYKFLYVDRLLARYPECQAERLAKVVPVECANVTHAHNFWLLLGAETGIFIAIGFTLFIGYLCFRGVKALYANQLKPGDRAILVGYLFAFGSCTLFALFDVAYYDVRVNVMTWILLGGIYTLSQSPISGATSESPSLPKSF